MFSRLKGIISKFKIVLLLKYGVLVFGALLVIAFWITLRTSAYQYNDVSVLPKNSVGLLLGTSEFTVNGQKNVFYERRIQAAKELYESKKIDCLLLSGDNTTLSYNEPISMQQSLLAVGIPAERMYLDYAGIRTLDSILRARDIFGLSNFTIISQPFHLDRALFLAHWNGIDAVGYEAGSIRLLSAPGVYIREIFSRSIALYDVLFETTSRFGGKKIDIEYDETVRPVPSKICSPRE